MQLDGTSMKTTTGIEHKFHISESTGNRKTGRLTTTTTSRSSCTDACGFKTEVKEDGTTEKRGCYAEQFHMKMHWDKVDSGERGMSLDEFCNRAKKLTFKSLVRHNQAGDLPGDGKYTLYRDACLKIAKAFRRVTAATYTAYPLTSFNLETILEMIRLGFVVNKSCTSLRQVDEAMDKGVPATVVLPSYAEGKKHMTPKDRLVVRCPAEISKDINCSNCGGNKGPLCWRPERDFAVAFYAHGIYKRKVDEVLAEIINYEEEVK